MKGGVYFIRCPQSGLVKIGRGADPVSRLADLQTGSASRLELVAVIQTDDSKSLEAELHKRFSEHRSHCEWFHCTDELQNLIDSNAIEATRAPSRSMSAKRCVTTHGKVGRPSLGTKGRSNVLTLKVSTEERSRWQDAADRQGITLGAWLREAAELAWARGASR